MIARVRTEQKSDHKALLSHSKRGHEGYQKRSRMPCPWALCCIASHTHTWPDSSVRRHPFTVQKETKMTRLIRLN